MDWRVVGGIKFLRSENEKEKTLWIAVPVEYGTAFHRQIGNASLTLLYSSAVHQIRES